MLIIKRPVGTVAFLGGLPAVLEEFAWSWGQMIQFNNESLCRPSKGEFIHQMRSTSTDKAESRNILSRGFMGDWLFMTDTDHAFDPDIVFRLVTLAQKRGATVLTGVYRYKHPPHLPVVYSADPETGDLGYLQSVWGEIIEVGCAGGGCLLVYREVFDKIRDELKQEPFDHIPPYKEDFSFFKRCRELKIPIFCAPTVTSDHLTIKRVTEADFDPSQIGMIPESVSPRG